MPGTSTKPAMILINLSAVACIANELTWQREVPVSIMVDIDSRLGLVMQPLNPLSLANEKNSPKKQSIYLHHVVTTTHVSWPKQRTKRFNPDRQINLYSTAHGIVN